MPKKKKPKGGTTLTQRIKKRLGIDKKKKKKKKTKKKTARTTTRLGREKRGVSRNIKRDLSKTARELEKQGL